MSIEEMIERIREYFPTDPRTIECTGEPIIAAIRAGQEMRREIEMEFGPFRSGDGTDATKAWDKAFSVEFAGDHKTD